MDTQQQVYELLIQQIQDKSIGKVALELGLSKATVSLVARKKYPNPKNIYKKIKEKYCITEIIGVQVTTNDLVKLLKEIEE